MQIINIEQGSKEWFDIRQCKMTASHAQAIGNIGKGLDTYILDLMAEHYSSEDKEQISTKDTERGNELEPIARDIYELETGNKVSKVGFIEYNEYVGCSPDGLIGEDGIWECKAPDDKTYFRILLNKEEEIDTKYIWQIQMEMLITGRKWTDLTFYNPNFKQRTIIFRILPDKEKFEALLKGFDVGQAKILEIKNKLNVSQ